MSQNQLITILFAILLLVIGASAFILLTPSPETEVAAPSTASPAGVDPNHFQLDVLQQQAYKLLNKQLVKEGALPVEPTTNAGKANPFL